MPLLRIVDRSGIEHEVESTSGASMMEILRELDYGVAATCGGECSCATCHVYVDTQWLPRLHAATPGEGELLASLAHRRNESRLSCQIEFEAGLDGLRLTIAPEE